MTSRATGPTAAALRRRGRIGSLVTSFRRALALLCIRLTTVATIVLIRAPARRAEESRLCIRQAPEAASAVRHAGPGWSGPLPEHVVRALDESGRHPAMERAVRLEVTRAVMVIEMAWLRYARDGARGSRFPCPRSFVAACAWLEPQHDLTRARDSLAMLSHM